MSLKLEEPGHMFVTAAKGKFPDSTIWNQDGSSAASGVRSEERCFLLSYCEVWNVCYTFVMHVLTDTILIVCPWGTELSLASYDNS